MYTYLPHIIMNIDGVGKEKKRGLLHAFQVTFKLERRGGGFAGLL